MQLRLRSINLRTVVARIPGLQRAVEQGLPLPVKGSPRRAGDGHQFKRTMLAPYDLGKRFHPMHIAPSGINDLSARNGDDGVNPLSVETNRPVPRVSAQPFQQFHRRDDRNAAAQRGRYGRRFKTLRRGLRLAGRNVGDREFQVLARSLQEPPPPHCYVPVTAAVLGSQRKFTGRAHSHEKSLRLMREKWRTSSPVTMKITRSATFAA